MLMGAANFTYRLLLIADFQIIMLKFDEHKHLPILEFAL